MGRWADGPIALESSEQPFDLVPKRVEFAVVVRFGVPVHHRRSRPRKSLGLVQIECRNPQDNTERPRCKQKAIRSVKGLVPAASGPPDETWNGSLARKQWND